MQTVSRKSLEGCLTALRCQVQDPRAGLFGPGSKLWEVNKHSIVFLGAGRAALLQLAHPWVAYAIEHHSNTREDPLGRFQRTFARVFAMVYGDLDSAVGAAGAVHAIHEGIQGDVPGEALARPSARYWANEPRALLWVHATLWETSVRMFECIVRPLDLEEKQRFYQDTKRFALLFGIPEDVLPRDWDDFVCYFESMLAGDELRVTPPAAEMARFLMQGPHRIVAPLMPRYRLLTAHFLPPQLGEAFGLSRGGEAGRKKFESTLRGLQRVHPYLPRRLRYVPAYVAARRRLAGRLGRDWIGEQLARVFEGSGARPS